MVDLLYCLLNLLFFNIPLLYYYTNINSSVICCLFSGDIYLSFGISTSSAILLPIKSPVASAVFLIALFEAAFIASIVDYLALLRSF